MSKHAGQILEALREEGYDVESVECPRRAAPVVHLAGSEGDDRRSAAQARAEELALEEARPDYLEALGVLLLRSVNVDQLDAAGQAAARIVQRCVKERREARRAGS